MNEKERVMKKIEKVLVKYREEGLNQDNVDFKNYAAHDILEIIGEAKDFVRKQERIAIGKFIKKLGINNRDVDNLIQGQALKEEVKDE